METIFEMYETHHWFIATLGTIAFVVSALGVAFGLICLQSWVVMLLWNWVAVSLFNAPVLSFWLAFGLNWLCHLLFKGSKTISKRK